MEVAASVAGLYRRHGLAWARDRDRETEGGLYEAAWKDRFTALLPPGAAVLDLGCGSGRPWARALADDGCHITGVDTAPDLVALARQAVPHGTFHVADMRGLALDRAFDGVLAWDSLFHLVPAGQRQMLPVFAAHARPGAPLMFTSGPDAGEAIGSYGGEPLYHASLAPAEYRALLDAHGFTVVHHRAEDPDCGRRTVWLARRT